MIPRARIQLNGERTTGEIYQDVVTLTDEEWELILDTLQKHAEDPKVVALLCIIDI